MIKHSIPLKWILIPVEIKPREFDARLLLSCFAAESGYSVILGKSSTLHKHLKQLPKGVYLSKSLSPGSLPYIQHVTRLGHLVTSLDEEGVGGYLGKYYAQTRLTHDILPYISHIFTWGKEDTKAFSECFPESKEKIVISGNPRIDLWRKEFREIYKPQVQKLRNQYGQYILFPSNFWTSSHVNGPNFVWEQARKYGLNSEQSNEKFLREQSHYVESNYQKILETLPLLASEIKNHRLIIRPHPVESHKPWQELEKKAPNIKVIYEGGITPWILGADLIIHHGCTTGIESFFLEVPSIAYLPFQDAKFDPHLANLLSWAKVYDFNSLKNSVLSLLGNKLEHPYAHLNEPQTIAKENFASIEEGLFASDKIIETIHTLPLTKERLCFSPTPRWAKVSGQTLKGLKEYFIPEKIRVATKKLFKKKYVRQSKLYTEQKFPRTTLEEAQIFLNQARNVANRFYAVQACQLEENLFCLFPKGSVQ
ncbi:MAG: hypothetical protein HY559_01905 [Gammaproteobacteria bacterium]|nr:hypothetical protein [Gammaproteobacteria bacterium]